MAYTPEELLVVYCPQMALTSGYSIYIDQAKLLTSSGYFGDYWSQAVCLRAAHMWTLNSKRPGTSGVETFLMEGRLSKSYGGVGVIRDGLQLTNYGMQLLDLMDSLPASVGTVASSTILTTYMTSGL